LTIVDGADRPLRAISLFSGVGGMDQGFDRAGIETVLQAEQDEWCLGVLARHWPDTRRVNDVREVTGGRHAWGQPREHQGGARLDGAIDLVYGGWPCQGNSVAGKRAGLSDERSGLWHEVRRVLRELRPRWFVGENVPGLLSVCSCLVCQFLQDRAREHGERLHAAGGKGACGCTECREGKRLLARHRGRDFGRILVDLEELGYGVAWRTLDARHFGVAQRRRRVFIVGCLGDAARAGQVLAVCESCGGHPAPGRAKGEDLAYALAASARGTGDGHGNAWNSTYVPVGAVARGQAARNSRLDGDADTFIVDEQNAAVVPSVGTLGTGLEHTNRGFLVASAQRASDGHHGHSSPRGDGADNLIPFDTTQITSAANYSRPRAGGADHPLAAGAHPPAIAFHQTQDPISEREVAPSLGATSIGMGVYALRSDASRDGVARTPSADAEGRVRLRDPGFNVYEEAPTLDGNAAHSVGGSFGVRRLTPLECERLMGWGDEWTRWAADGREVPDSHRYRMCGNGVVATVAQWLAYRLVRADAFIREQEHDHAVRIAG
jgi:DNA (cytosine-5)-methyltransferase 1